MIIKCNDLDSLFTMGNSKDGVDHKDMEITIGLVIMEISMSFSFSAFPFANLEYVGDFKWEQKSLNLHQSESSPFRL